MEKAMVAACNTATDGMAAVITSSPSTPAAKSTERGDGDAANSDGDVDTCATDINDVATPIAAGGIDNVGSAAEVASEKAPELVQESEVGKSLLNNPKSLYYMTKVVDSWAPSWDSTQQALVNGEAPEEAATQLEKGNTWNGYLGDLPGKVANIMNPAIFSILLLGLHLAGCLRPSPSCYVHTKLLRSTRLS
jgi:hypothetical protein